MSKRLILILALAFVLGISYAAYAEVQNVKVSGDLTTSGVARDNFDLVKTSPGPLGQVDTANFKDTESDILSIARVRVDADLTDNISATVRLLNERNWNGESRQGGITRLGNANTNVGLGTANTANDENDIDLDLAYVTVKEFLYSPLSLSVGRQNLRFGNGLVVGDPDTNIYSAATSLAEGDLSARKSFDAARATLDYNPLVVDLIYAKISEEDVNTNGDIDLSGLNASYELSKNTTLEGFFFTRVKGQGVLPVFNIDAENATSFDTFQKRDIVHTIGLRAVDTTVKNLTLDGQIAWQVGKYNPRFDPNARYNTVTSDEVPRMHSRKAMALQLKAVYDLKDVALISKYSPVISAGYTYLSGANRDQEPGDEYEGWDPMFEDQTEGHILNAIIANTNMHRVLLGAKAKLTDDITANLDYIAAWFAKRAPRDLNRKVVLSGIAGTSAATTGRQYGLRGEKYISSEIDATLTYDYTEDVQFSLLGGVLLLGNNIRISENNFEKGMKADAVELIGSMKVTF